MGICESDMNTKRLDFESLAKSNQKNINDSKVISLKNKIKEGENSNLSQKLPDSYPTNIIENANININLQRYEPSLDMNNSNINQSEINSKSKEEEIIIKGKVNLNCQNKENDFDNKSFMNLIKSNGGIVLKEDTQNNNELNKQKENEILYDFEKDDISEIKSQSSLDEKSQSKNIILSALNGKKNKREVKSEMSKGKFTEYTLVNNELYLGKNINFDNKSKYTTNTIRPKINLNRYLNGIFSNEYNAYNGDNNIQRNNNNQLLNNNIIKSPLEINKKPSHNNINNGFQNSLFSNYYNNTNDTINEGLRGSFISAPKNDERIQEFLFNMNQNQEDIISILSSH